MNFELFTAKRLALGDNKSFSRFIIRIAVVAIALSVAVMIVSTCMVSGFSKEIKERIFGFWGQIHITSFENNDSYESTPIKQGQVLVDKLRKATDVSNVAPFIIKAGILKTKTDIEGIVLKGVNAEYDWNTIRNYLKQGRILSFNDTMASKEIMVSQSTAKAYCLSYSSNPVWNIPQTFSRLPIGDAKSLLIK